jgi:hypothetical protein
VLREEKILSRRGNSPRQYPNTLVFLAADRARLDELLQTARCFLDRPIFILEPYPIIIPVGLRENDIFGADEEREKAGGLEGRNSAGTIGWGRNRRSCYNPEGNAPRH